jgi:hypothetical protein
VICGLERADVARQQRIVNRIRGFGHEEHLV